MRYYTYITSIDTEPMEDWEKSIAVQRMTGEEIDECEDSEPDFDERI